MAKRRTRKQKIKAKTSQQPVRVKYEPENTRVEIKKKQVSQTENSLDRKLIIQDLIKTGLISLLLLGLLIGAYFYLN